MWPTIVEVVGHTGSFDYIEFSVVRPIRLNQLENWVRTTELGMSSMIKLDRTTGLAPNAPSGRFPDVSSPTSGRPTSARRRQGRPRRRPGSRRVHGVADRRNAAYESCRPPAVHQALDDIVVAIMIEKAAAVEQLDEIPAVPGIDASSGARPVTR
jgi:hypothetical protein